MSKNFTFNTAPAIQMKRSRISGLSYGVNSSYSMGRVYPFYCEEILPGDTFKVNSNFVVRLTSSFLKPVYGNLFADVFYFFVPWRLVYDDFPCVFGENRTGYWGNARTYEVPHAFSQTCFSKSVADYLEFPVGQINAPVNILYHRAVALVWNEWFRDENYQEPVHIHTGDFDASEALNNKEWSVNNYTGLCPPISKYRDYFTSVLPSPQKGEAVQIPIGSGELPVRTRSSGYTFTDPEIYPLTWQYSGTVKGQQLPDNAMNIVASPIGNPAIQGEMQAASDPSLSSGAGIYPDNLYADIANASIGSINDLRMAFQTQKILERDSLGTRYVEHILNTFGVVNPDARLQRPELLNGSRFPITIQQVASTGANGSSGSLAQLGAYSLSSGKTGFSKAFTEYGCVIGFVAFRQFHSYQQGMPRRYTRYKRLDYYNPALAYVGMMPVHSTEIYAKADYDDIFGYQRAWSEYRHHQNVISGEMRSGAENTLDVWHLGDEYSSQPYASAEFMQETPNNLNRVITVASTAQDQFICDIWNNVDAVRVMPSNPMPGLIDHY